MKLFSKYMFFLVDILIMKLSSYFQIYFEFPNGLIFLVGVGHKKLTFEKKNFKMSSNC